MKSIIAGLFAALVFASPVAAAPNPADVSNPETQYVVTRVLPNQTEKTLAVYEHVEGSFSSEQAIRLATFEFAKAERLNNPAWRIMIYGPTNGGPHVDDDRIWDSAVNTPE